jgi:hypothetical protein
MIAASNHSPLSKGDMFWMRFSGAVHGCEDLVFAVFYIRRPVRFVEKPNLQFDWAKFINASTIDTKTVLIE